MKAAATIAFYTHQDDDHSFTYKVQPPQNSKLLKLVWQQEDCNIFPIPGIQIAHEHPVWKNLIWTHNPRHKGVW